MTARTWFYNQIMASPLLEERVFAKKSMTSSREQHPFAVYKFGNNTNEDLAEDIDASRQYTQIYIHDFEDGDSADYMKIDAIIADLKARFRFANSPEDGVVAVIFLETSQDLNDETLNTVMKYIRVQLVMKE